MFYPQSPPFNFYSVTSLTDVCTTKHCSKLETSNFQMGTSSGECSSQQAAKAYTSNTFLLLSNWVNRALVNLNFQLDVGSFDLRFQF